ncbi:MAG: extracellular solute-binding protein [Bifidobacteriaceae bacterium]|jgi:multiple sugar transport system substrate-binding protein|nr:extracellular solute-binding protein [Bifidobacteriaceae bacterium]
MMLKRTSRITCSAAVAALLIGLAGCGDNNGSDTSDSPGTDQASQPVALRMTVWTGNEDHLSLFNSIADEYVAANGDKVSSVTFETLPYDEYTQTLTTQISGGNAPDLAWILEASGPEFVASGILSDLKPALESAEGYNLDEVLDSALALWQKDGSIYAYPFSNSPFGVLVNTTMLTEAGQPLPKDLIASGDWTWDKLRQISAAAVAATGKGGFYLSGFESYLAWQFMAEAWDSWDAAPWSADGTTCTFTDKPMVDFMTWYHDAVYVDNAIPQPGVVSDFYAGEAAMVTAQISRAAGLDGSFEWDIVPLPEGPAGLHPVIGQAGIGVLAQGANPAAAADFLAFFTNPANSAKLAQYFPPPRESLLNTDVLGAANPLLTAEQLQAVVIDQMPDAVTLPSHVVFAEVSDAARIVLDDLWTAQADVPSVMANICEAIDPLLGN